MARASSGELRTESTVRGGRTEPTVHGGGHIRDSWCTPEWLTAALGRFDLDPCSNARSTVDADRSLCLDAGHDGLGDPGEYSYDGEIYRTSLFTKTFVNPPYSRGSVRRWVDHYLPTNFTFLLRWDPSTQWWKRLMERSRWVWFPNQRIQFEPPPGVTGRSNPFPHALYFASRPVDGVHKRLGRLGRFAFVYPES